MGKYPELMKKIAPTANKAKNGTSVAILAVGAADLLNVCINGKKGEAASHPKQDAQRPQQKIQQEPPKKTGPKKTRTKKTGTKKKAKSEGGLRWYWWLIIILAILAAIAVPVYFFLIKEDASEDSEEDVIV